MFWAGALVLVVGGVILSSNNPNWGASMAITTQLRHNSKGQESDRDATKGFVRGMLIAAPGIVMIGVSYFVLG